MPTYMPIYPFLSSFVFDATQIFSRTCSFKNSLIKLTSKIWLNADKITSVHCTNFHICFREKLPQKIVKILLNQAENSFNSKKIRSACFLKHILLKSKS